jgi:hypothetical protein
MEPTGAEQPRENGRYAKKPQGERPNRQGINLVAIARNEIRKLAAETDGSALADVQPKGQKATQTKDPAPQSAATTSADKHDAQSSPAATHVAKHLEDAEKALERDGFTKEDIAGLSKERILALGKKAAERQADISRKLGEEAKTKAAPAGDAKTTDPGSPKPVTTAPTQAKTEEADPFEALVKEHFAAFAEDADFSKSLGGFSKALANQLKAEIETGLKSVNESVTTMRAEMVKEIRAEAAREMEFEKAVESLKDDFPESSSVDGRAALRDLFVTLAKEGKVKDIVGGVRSSANALWADAKRARDTEAAKQKASRDARKNGQPITGSAGAGPKTGPPSIVAIARTELRKAFEAGGT